MRPRPSRKMFPHRVDVVKLNEERNANGGTSMVPTTVATAVVCLIDRTSGGRSWMAAAEVEKNRSSFYFPTPSSFASATN